MTFAADDVEHIAKALRGLPAAVTTGGGKLQCQTCNGLGLILLPLPDTRAVACPACRPTPSQPAKAKL